MSAEAKGTCSAKVGQYNGRKSVRGTDSKNPGTSSRDQEMRRVMCLPADDLTSSRVGRNYGGMAYGKS